MAPPSNDMSNVHNGLVNTRTGILTLTTTNSPWKTAKLDRRGLLHTILPIILQEMVMGCGALTTNLTIVLSMKAIYKYLNRVGAGATPPISMIPFPEMPPPRRRRRKIGGQGQRMHTLHRDRRRKRKSPRIDRQWGTQQTSTQQIHNTLNLLRHWKFQRTRQGELMENARRGMVSWGREMAKQ